MRPLLIALLTFAYAALAPAAEYERRLVPVAVVMAPGAHGTLWTTRAKAVQELEEGTEIVGDLTLDVPPWIAGGQPYNVFPSSTDREPPGAIMHVRKDVAHAIHISARLLQHGPGREHEETAIPVVGEDEFVNHTLYFMPLTRRSDRRVHLRVYSLDVERATAAVRVRIQAPLPFRGWTFIYDTVHALDVHQKTRTPMEGGDPLPLRPYAIEMLLDPLVADLPPDTELAVSVVPADEGVRIWGIVSETDNTTQQIRLVFAQ
jgi:hypothetical protein